jgi:acyl-CoA thioester hydrolase
MASKLSREIPVGAVTSHVRYTVPFYDTDGMGIVHHANYIRYLELGRVRFLKEHDRPYGEYVEQGFHVAVIGVEAQYRRACKFDEELEVVCWLAWLRHASMGFGYLIRVGDQVSVSATTDHAVVDTDGRPVRIPRELHERLGGLIAPSA